MPVTSNLILKTSLPKPTGSGYSDVISKLRTVDRLLDSIISKSTVTITIKYNVVGKAPKSPPRSRTSSAGGGGRGAGAGREPEGNLPRPRRRKFPINTQPQSPPLDLVDQIGSTTTTKTSFSKSGKKKTSVTEAKQFQNIENDILYTAEQKVSAKGNEVNLIEKQVNLGKKEQQLSDRTLAKRRAALDLRRQELNAFEKQLRKMGYIEDQSFKSESIQKLVEGRSDSEERLRRKRFYKVDPKDPTTLRTFELTDELGKKSVKTGRLRNKEEIKARQDIARAEREQEANKIKAQKILNSQAEKQWKDQQKAEREQEANKSKAQKYLNRLAEKQWQDSEKARAAAQRKADKDASDALKPARDAAEAQALFAARRARIERVNQALIAKGYKLQEETATKVEQTKGSGVYENVSRSVFTRQDPRDPTKTNTVTTNSATGRVSLRGKDNRDVIREQKKRAENARRTADIEDQANSLLSQGFSRTADKLIRDSQGMTYAVQQFARTSGNALTGYAVELARVNTLTGKTEAEILTGARAWKFLGDSVARSTVKVALWTAATSAVFGTIAAIKSATEAIADLEAGTVLLARVGAGLGSNFETRMKQAQELTAQIVSLAEATSTSAVEGQKAAAVFLRTGQTQREAVKSVTAALVASRIAELGVVEAAQLLTAAQTQFGLSADQLIPTLDTLNELSNKYRVTTDDLLQAISRTGGVFEQQGGKLSELAAIIAVTSQVTARSGAEIGNAIKTVESRLASAENADVLLQKAGVGFRSANGEARSLADVLLDLQLAFRSMTASEQDAVTVSAAGVRQRNILIAQIKGAVDIIIAESRALRGDQDEYSKYGSAISEAAQTAGTLEAQVKKLMASFIALASSGAGPVSAFLKSVIFALQNILNLLSAFNGAPAKILAFAALVTVVNLALNKMNLGTLSLSQALTQLFTAITAGAGPALVAMRAFLATIISTLGPAVALSGVIILLTKTMAYFADRSAKAALLLQLQASGHDAAAAQAAKQREAIVSLSNALGKQIQVYNELGKAGNKAQQALVKQGIDKLLKELEANGIKIPVDFDSKNPKKVAELQVNIQKKANEKLYAQEASVRKQIQSEVLARDKKRSALIERRTLLAQANIKGYATSLDPNASAANIATARAQMVLSEGNIGALFDDAELKQIDEELKRYEGGIGDSGTATDEFAQKINKLQEELAGLSKQANEARLGASVALQVREAINELIDLDKQLTNIDKNSSQLGDIFDTLGIGERGALSTEIKQTTDVLDKFKEKMEFLAKQPISTENSKLIDDLGNSMDKAAIKLRGLTAAKEKFDAVSIQKTLKEIIDFDSALDIAKTNVDVVKSRVNLDPEKYSQKNNGLFEKINERNRLVQQAGNLISNANASKDPNVIASNKAAAQDRLNQAASKELEIQSDIYDKEKAIVEEKKKANEELQRSLGLLSEEDKARLLVQADYFKKNPNAKLSIEQQFAGSSENNRIAQDYFNNRLETSDQARARGSALQQGVFDNLINKDMQDMAVQQAELDRQQQRAGGAGGSRDRFIGNVLAANRLGGGPEIPNTSDNTTPNAGINMNLNTSGLDLGPLITKFEEVAITRMDTLAADMIARLEALEAKYTAPPRRPGVAAGAGGN